MHNNSILTVERIKLTFDHCALIQPVNIFPERGKAAQEAAYSKLIFTRKIEHGPDTQRIGANPVVNISSFPRLSSDQHRVLPCDLSIELSEVFSQFDKERKNHSTIVA